MNFPRLWFFAPLSCLVVVLSGPLRLQATEPSGSGEVRQFDFWVGCWEVTSDGEVAGTNCIELILDGRVLRETWKGVGGYNGTSNTIYDTTTGTWKQFWVDNSGLTLLLEGGLEDGVMVLSGKRLDGEGRPVMDRITWTPGEDETVRQLWETSADEGETWVVGFDGLYRRKS